MKTHLCQSLGLLALFSVTACGDAQRVNYRVLTELSQEESVLLCEDIERLLHAPEFEAQVAKVGCYQAIAQSDELTAACEAEALACEGGAGAFPKRDCSTFKDHYQASGCAFKVSEFLECLKWQMDTLEDEAASLTCSNVSELEERLSGKKGACKYMPYTCRPLDTREL